MAIAIDSLNPCPGFYYTCSHITGVPSDMFEKLGHLDIELAHTGTGYPLQLPFSSSYISHHSNHG